MWRDDGLYDLVVEIGYNDAPPRPGAGSAIFLHLARPDWTPTEGCVAMERADLLAVLAAIGPGSLIDIAAV
jgi:L,D-peptidoglycan transpeptidase YkuD (ErfK/YbiS/YcfS/YnhG family)